MTRALAGLSMILALASTEPGAEDAVGRAFRGSCSSSGVLVSLPTEGDRPAAILHLSGSLVLTSGEGLARGFRAEVVAFDDGRALRVGRAVWTDDRGDRVYSALEGAPFATGGRITGTITGGTGRYAGLTGEYAFTWQYAVRAEDGTIQGWTSDLEGRFRLPSTPR